MGTKSPYPFTPPEMCDAEISNISDYLYPFFGDEYQWDIQTGEVWKKSDNIQVCQIAELAFWPIELQNKIF